MPAKLKLSEEERQARRREQVRQSVAKWQATLPEEAKQAGRRHYNENIVACRERARAYYWTHREKKFAYARQRQTDQRERLCADMREFYRQSRKEVFEHYGEECACCGETQFEMLTIDHIGGCT